MYMRVINVNIGNLIIPTFDKPFYGIVDNEYNRVVLKGGRNSTKSSVVALAIVIGVMKHKSDGICMVKYDNKVYERLVSTFIEVIKRANLEGMFRYKINKKELVLLDRWEGRETEHSIKFTGVDDPQKLKSFKPRSGKGGFRYIWFEEVTDFNSLSEVNNVINTMARGEGKHTVIMTYNPPKSTNHWVNKEYNSPCGKVLGYDSNSYTNEFEIEFSGGSRTYKKVVKQLVHHSTYLDILEAGHPEWLGETLVNAELTKENNIEQYRWEYLGEAIGTEGNVFRNVRDLKNIEFSKKYIYRGIDFGFTKDPTVYVEWAYDEKKKEIYMCNEFSGKRMSNSAIKDVIKLYNKHNFRVWADSSEPRTINELNKLGLNVVGVKKGADSVRYGVKWLQSLNGIYINPIKCPFTYKEFTEYEYKKDRQGEYTGELEDKNNHSIDATRYALSIKMDY